MALPSDLTLITVTGTYLNVTGAVLTGQVNFSLTTPVQDATGKVILNAFTQPVPLNSNGSVSIVLPCTDNANFSPANPSYLVTEQIPGLGRAYYIQLPHTLGATVDLSQLAPVTAPPVNTAFGTANTWTATQAYSGNPGLKITTGAAAGDVLTSDAAGNATWAAATGGITPPAGDIGGTTTAPAVVSTHLTDALPLTQGGTGQVTAQAALDALAGATTSGDYLRGNGTHVAMSAVQAADLPAATTSTQGAVVLDGTAADIQPAGVAAAGTKGQAADAKHVHPYQAYQFLPEAYGAKGDGKVVGDAAITSGHAVLTSAAANFTSADSGKTFMVNGALGATGAPLIATGTFVNSTTMTLSANATATVSGGSAFWATDDTAAINSAVTAAQTYALANNYKAQVIFGAKFYGLASGPTQAGDGSTTPTFNSQIPLPYPNANGSTQKLVIEFIGAGNAGQCQFWESTIPNLQGTCLVSMIIPPAQPASPYGYFSVLGGPTGPSGFTGGFANVKPVIQGITVVTPALVPGIALDFRYAGGADAPNASCQAFASVAGNSPNLPSFPSNAAITSGAGIALYMPIDNNNDDCNVGSFAAEGYGVGLAVSEHFTAQRIAAIYCDTGLFVRERSTSTPLHGISVLYYSCEATNTVLTSTDGVNYQVPVFIGLMDVEAINTADITDWNNNFTGEVHWADWERTAPAVNGGTGMKIVNERLARGVWSGAPAVPASATAQQNTAWRDATVYVTGTLTGNTTVDGTSLGTAAAMVRVPAGHTITLTYSVAPTWVWVLD